MPLTRVRNYVQQYDKSLEPVLFEQKLNTCDEAAAALGVEAGQVAKSILFVSEGEYALFVASGDVRIHPKRVKQLIGGKPKMASPDEVLEVTGFIVGAVCPFALLKPIPIYIDRTLARFPVVYTAAGIPESLLPVSFDQLVGITGGTVTGVVEVE